MRKLAAIMFTDIVGYTALMGEDEPKALQLLQKNRELLKPIIEQFHGEWLKEIGDGTLSSFNSAVEAVNCALAIQHVLRDDPDLILRIGIHVGDVVFEGGDVFGDGVNVASRIEPLAEPGGICVSGRVYDDIQNKPDIETIFLGEKALKHVKRPIKVYALTGEGLPAPTAGSGAVESDQPAAIDRGRHYAMYGGSVLAVVLAFLVYGLYFKIGSSDIRWARNEAIPKLISLVEAGEYQTGYLLAKEVEQILPADSIITKFLPRATTKVNISSDPLGAEIYWKPYRSKEVDWNYFGQTPLESVKFPKGAAEIIFVLEGYDTLRTAFYPWIEYDHKYKLHTSNQLPEGMVWVPGGEFYIFLPGLERFGKPTLNDFYIDKYEVINKQFKEFINSGAYQNREYWKIPFIQNGTEVSWEAAMSEFRDQTGLPGPSTWIGGNYPKGEDNHPVGGLSWYEAAAYAEFAGKALPTISHWNRASGPTMAGYIAPFSNFNSQKSAPVGAYQGISPPGTYDMGGNVREWCWNSGGSGSRYILGGGWNDDSYMINDAYTQSAFDRSPTNGFRCAIYQEDTQTLSYIGREIVRLLRNFYDEQPVSNEVFEIYKSMYAYDKSPLNATVEKIHLESDDRTREKIIFDAAYGGERMQAYIFLPKDTPPPYQTVIYFPGSNALSNPSSKYLETTTRFEYLLKSGRAVMFPIYKSTFERGDDLKSDLADETKFYRDHLIMWTQDFSRSIDYLETRSDIDANKLAYFGISWGGAMGAIIPAVEGRIQASVLVVAGMGFEPALPEVDPINFVTRVKVPTIMLNGKHDHFFPLETSQKPMIDLLGTPNDDKKLVVYQTGHATPRAQRIIETLAWLDRYLGPVH